MDPANQSLRAGQHRRVGADIEFWLVVDLELTAGDGLRKVFDHLLFPDLLDPHVVIVSLDPAAQVPPDLIRGLLGPVKPPLDIHGFVYILVDPHPQPDAVF